LALLLLVTVIVQPNANMKLAAFWVVAPCSLATIALMMEAESNCKTTERVYQTTGCNNPETSHLQTHRNENFQSQIQAPFLTI
jgi:hypothetical protein